MDRLATAKILNTALKKKATDDADADTKNRPRKYTQKWSNWGRKSEIAMHQVVNKNIRMYLYFTIDFSELLFQILKINDYIWLAFICDEEMTKMLQFQNTFGSKVFFRDHFVHLDQ